MMAMGAFSGGSTSAVQPLPALAAPLLPPQRLPAPGGPAGSPLASSSSSPSAVAVAAPPLPPPPFPLPPASPAPLSTRLETLQRAMAEAVRLQQFERCIGLRDSIRSIEAEMAMQAATATGEAEAERTTHQHG